jgi:hypothetical protein
MNAEQILLDPTSERTPTARALLARPASFEGLTVGILDISKARGDVFLDHIAARLGERGVGVRRYKKPTFTRPAPTELKQQIATECNLVIEGLAD